MQNKPVILTIQDELKRNDNENQAKSSELQYRKMLLKIKLKSLILAQDERWRRA